MLQVGFRLNQKQILKRYLSLSLCSSPLIGAYFFGYTEATSPFKCIFLAMTGIPCPGCGLTRSFLASAHNNFQQAVNYHLFGPLLFFGLSLACVHLILELYFHRSIKAFYGKFLSNQFLQFTLLGAILSYHFLRLYALFVSGELASSFQQSPLGQLVL